MPPQCGLELRSELECAVCEHCQFRGDHRPFGLSLADVSVEAVMAGWHGTAYGPGKKPQRTSKKAAEKRHDMAVTNVWYCSLLDGQNGISSLGHHLDHHQSGVTSAAVAAAAAASVVVVAAAAVSKLVLY